MEDKRPHKFMFFFIFVCFVVGVIITISQMNNQTLQGYVENSNNIIATVEPYSTPNPIPNMQQVTDNTVGLSMYVPQGWTRVIRNGNITYVEPDTAAYIQIVKQGYVPGLSSIDENTIQNDINNIGAYFVSFERDGNYGYTVLYQNYENDVIYNYIEVTRIDFNNVVRIIVSAPDDTFNQLSDAITASVNSIEWNPPNPIPDEYMLCYSEFGNFEFAVPSAWSKGIENDEYVARDPISGSEMHISVSQSNTTYQGVNQSDFAEYLAPGKDGFSIKQFTTTDNLIYCVSSYYVNGFEIYRVDYFLTNGMYEYGICFLSAADLFQETSPLFDQAFSLFRTF